MKYRLRRLAVTLARPVAATGGLLASTASPAVAAAPSAHQLVPDYLYPFPAKNYWDHPCQDLNAQGDGSTIIVTSGDPRSGDGLPTGGPTATYDANYAQGIENCHYYGQNVIGYVDSADANHVYAARPIADVEADIARWQTFYATNHTGVTDKGANGIDTHIDGIFLDEMANNPNAPAAGWPGHTVKQYYSAIYQYENTHAAAGYETLVGNPGAPATTDWQLNDTGTPNTQAADEVVVFEGPQTSSAGVGLNSYSPPSWVRNYPARDIAMLVHTNTDTAAAFSSTCSTLANDNSGLNFVTNLGNGDAGWSWTTLTGSTEMDWNRTYCG